ncbi:MAG: T9SS type A sorting domain-containing protein [Chitinophagales bacterium]|nr:T9SS type A sorting domain-containing protein [Chitinophagaceae bacterium]MCB9065554.1 T9SS type A sorting domain-containing protein [Chitinophagales bacterium]
MKYKLYSIVLTLIVVLSIPNISSAQCADPTNLDTINVSNDKIIWQWDAVTNAVKYDYVIDTNTTYMGSTGGISTTGISVVTMGLKGNTQYCIHVRAFCGGTDTSAWVTFCATTKPNPTTGINNINKGNTSFEIYPNPTNETVNIQYNGQKAAGYSIHNIIGKKLISGSLQQESTAVNISSLPKGVYIINLIAGEKRQTLKLYKE